MKEKQIESRNIIKILLKTIIIQEKKNYSFANKLSKNKDIFKITIEPNELLPFEKLADALQLKEEKQCEAMYEMLGDMIDKRLDLDEELDKFIQYYNI